MSRHLLYFLRCKKISALSFKKLLWFTESFKVDIWWLKICLNYSGFTRYAWVSDAISNSGVAFKIVSIVKIENDTFPSKVGKSKFSVKQISGIFFREKARFAAYMLSMHLFLCNGGSISYRYKNFLLHRPICCRVIIDSGTNIIRQRHLLVARTMTKCAFTDKRKGCNFNYLGWSRDFSFKTNTVHTFFGCMMFSYNFRTKKSQNFSCWAVAKKDVYI